MGTTEEEQVARQLHRLADATDATLAAAADDAYLRSNLRALAGVLRNLAAQLTGPEQAGEEALRQAMREEDVRSVVAEARSIATNAVARTHPIDWVAVSGGR